MVVLLGLYYGLAWVHWDGHQSVLFDLPARKFYIFGWTFWPQDFFYLSMLLIVAALALFFFTALAGRLWCGYACPQTVWTEIYMWMERKIEGNRNAADGARQGADVGQKVRIKVDQAIGLDRFSRCGPASLSSATSRRSRSCGRTC